MERKVNYGSSHSLTGEIVDGVMVSQTFVAEFAELSSISINFATYKRNNRSRLIVEILDKNDTPVASISVSAYMLCDNQFYRVPMSCTLKKGDSYRVTITSPGTKLNQSVTAKYGKKHHKSCVFTIGGVVYPNGELNCIFEYTSKHNEESALDAIVVDSDKSGGSIVFPDRISICLAVDSDQDANDNSGLTFLQETIQSIICSGKNRNIELIIADWKRSINPLATWIYKMASMYFPIVYIEMKGSYNWGVAASEMVRRSRGKLFVFLHPHVKVDEEFLAGVEPMLKNPGALLPILRAPNNKWLEEPENIVISRSKLEATPNIHDVFGLREYLKANGARNVEVSGAQTLYFQSEPKSLRCDSGFTVLEEGKKIATFCLALKGRSSMALDSVKSLVTEESARFFDFIITEDESDDMLDLSSFPLAHHVKHYIVKTGDKWNRSKLCNYGFKRASTPVLVSWDADFIFPASFPRRFLSDITATDFSVRYLRIPVTETRDSIRGGTNFARGCLYGGMYVYGARELRAVGGYDEGFLLYGWEEKDANERLQIAGLKERRIEHKGYVFHRSHSDAMRGDLSNYNANKSRTEDHVKRKIMAVNESGWGDLPLVRRQNYDRTIVIMGNGPSLKCFDFELMRHFDCIGMNAAYRHFQKIGIYPRYHTCFDYVVTDNHADGLRAYIEDPDVTTERFFLLRPVSTSPKLSVIRLLPEASTFATDLDHFTNTGNTGTNSCQIALCLGYRRIILIGVDCNYVQFVDGAKVVSNTVIEMEKTPDTNPNYFIDDYQQKGDRFNIPNAHIYHRPAWERLAKYAVESGIDVVNCGPESKLDCFRRSTLEAEGISL